MPPNRITGAIRDTGLYTWIEERRFKLRTHLSVRLLLQYLVTVFVACVCTPFAISILYDLAHQITWPDHGLLYRVYLVLKWLWYALIPRFEIILIVTMVAITLFFIYRTLRYLDELVLAAGKLAQPCEEPIVLSPILQSAQDELNLLRQQALHNAAAVHEAEQRKNDLVIYLAHDLKTPLTSVIGYLTLLRDEPQISAELRARYTGIALEKAERLEALTNEFFEITRFNLSRMELAMETVDVARMLQQIVSEFAPLLTQSELTCTLETPPTLPCLCDPDKLARVFDNLLRNACHYSFAQSTVRVAATANADAVVITVTNDGRTIPPEKLSRMFEQFFRLDSARATQTGGAGLGLAIAQQIVTLHGGTICAESADNTVTLTVTLPQRVIVSK